MVSLSFFVFLSPRVRNAETKIPTPKQQAITISCPVCKETVAGQRFAPHLEKCLNGGKRGGLGNKKSTSFSSLGIGLPYYNVTKKVDHYPQSLVVRVKLKGGGMCPMFTSQWNDCCFASTSFAPTLFSAEKEPNPRGRAAVRV